MSFGKLYTVILEFYGSREVWIEQLSVPNGSPRSVLSAWGDLAIKHNILNSRNNKILQEELNDDDHIPVLLDGLSNIWYTSVLLNNGKDHFGLHIIKTNTRICRNNNRVVHICLSYPRTGIKYVQYEKQYRILQREKYRDKVINKRRKHIERWMRYWHTKAQFFNRGSMVHQEEYDRGLYTVIFDYAGGTYCNQLWLSNISSEPFLVEWAKLLSKTITNASCTEKTICNEEDHIILMNRGMEAVYQPIPISSLVNVWGTYFSLTKGIGNITIIKTALDEVA